MAERNKIIQVLVILGGLVALLNAISLIGKLIGLQFQIVPTTASVAEINSLVSGIILLVLSIITIISGVNAGEPIPFTAVALIIWAVLLIIFGSLLGGLLVLIGGILVFVD